MTRTIAVIGATGLQGGATARALLSRGERVRAFVRSDSSEAAQALRRDGAELVRGDLDDPGSLGRLLHGADGVFSVLLTAPPTDADREIRHARAVIAAAEGAGVRRLVHSSVSGWRDDSARALPHDEVYWRGKDSVDALVRRSSVPLTTIIRPALFMDNFLPPRLDRMFPEHAAGLLAAATGAGTPLPLTATADIGAAAAAAFADPELFAGAEIELAGDILSFEQIAAAMGLRYEQRAAEALTDRAPSWLEKQLWFEAVNHRARPEHSVPYGLRPRRFEVFLAETGGPNFG